MVRRFVSLGILGLALASGWAYLRRRQHAKRVAPSELTIAHTAFRAAMAALRNDPADADLLLRARLLGNRYSARRIPNPGQRSA